MEYPIEGRRYDVTIYNSKSSISPIRYKYAAIVRLEANIIIVEDHNGKRHIHRGDMEIVANEC